MKLRDKLLARPGRPLRLADWDPDDTLGFKKDDVAGELERSIARLDALQYLMYAEHRRALLVVLEGMDAAGKDGTIRHVMTGLNPQGCRVIAFKTPSPEEAEHDFLAHPPGSAPLGGHGDLQPIALRGRPDRTGAQARVEGRVSRRYDDINRFEDFLTGNGVVVVKFFLHIGKDKQKRRLEERLTDPTKQWKFSPPSPTFSLRRSQPWR